MKFETRELVNPSTRQLANLQFSIIIPTYKRNDLLALCLQRLQPAAQSLEASLYEVIVTDDAANPATEQLLLTQFPWATYTAGPQRGPAANRNHGAKKALGKWLVFLDDDCLPKTDLLKSYQNAIELNHDCRAFEGKISVDTSPSSYFSESPLNLTGGCFWSCNLCVENLLFQSMGGFNEGFIYPAFEDVELHLRLIKMKIHTAFANEAEVIHPWRQNEKLRDTVKKRYISLIHFLTLHPEQQKKYNWKYFVKSYCSITVSTLNNFKSFGPKGFLQKISIDLLQLKFAIKALLHFYP